AAGKWRKVLNEAGNLAGWESNGDESKLIQEMVDDIFQKKCSSSSSVDRNLVGMETRIEAVLSSLELDADDFDGKAFVENVREVSKSSFYGVNNLQEQILRSVLSNKDITVNSVHEGTKMMKTLLRGRKVLIVLDDVDDREQLEALSGEPNEWFKYGSKVIITTRDKQFLSPREVKFIDVNMLSRAKAICLLSKNAFRRDIPIEGYEELSRQVVKFADGLPLTIKALGAKLYGQNKLEWIDTLERLRTIPLKETMKKLELSYKSLDDDYKNGIRVLDQRSLINISEDFFEYGRLWMHDHIQEMGMNIVRRVPYPIEDEVSNWNLPNALRYLSWQWYPFSSLPKTFQANNLVGLHMGSGYLVQLWKDGEEKFLTFTDSELRTLDLSVAPNLETLILEGCNNLVELHFQVTPNLKELRIRECNSLEILHMPAESPKLTSLDLYIVKLRTLHLGITPNLETLRVKKCSDMVELQIPGECPKLVNLDLSCSKLKTLDLGNIPNLERLDLKNCYDLVEINAPIGCLKKLVHLDLSGCRRFEYFVFNKSPIEIRVGFLSELHLIVEFRFKCFYEEGSVSPLGNLEKLLSFCLCACTNTDSFSGSISSLPNVRKMKIEGCITEAPKDLDQLQCLEELVFWSTRIKHLPNNICMLKHLKFLQLKSCWLIEKLPEDLVHLECLEELYLTECIYLRDIPESICGMNRLKYFHLPYCILVEKLPEELGRLECLKDLNIEGVTVNGKQLATRITKSLENDFGKVHLRTECEAGNRG
ncbi:TMV resistance protein N-like protein, partial [Tanacetum coccineum]